MNIILYKGKVIYGVLGFFIDEMAAGFTKLGHNVTVVDLIEKDYMGKLIQSIRHNGCDFVLSFNGMGINIANDNQSLYDIIDVPFVAMMVDHPSYHTSRLGTKMNHLIVTCIDRTHLDFLAFYYPKGHIKVKSFLPHGGSATVNFSEQESLDVYLKKRTNQLLFAGSFKNSEKTWSDFSPDTVKLLDDITDCVLGNEVMTLEEAYNYVLKQHGMELDYEISKKVYDLLSYVDSYVRGYLRQTCLEFIAKAEIPIILCGSSWDNWLKHKKYKSITYLGERDYQYLLNDLQKTRIFLNNAHNYVQGAHERDFNAMLNGAVSITQFNDYYNEEFIDGKDIVLYKLKELDRLPDKIAWLLDNPEITWQISKAAKEKAEARHTWLHRAENVLSMVAIYKDLCNLKFG